MFTKTSTLYNVCSDENYGYEIHVSFKTSLIYMNKYKSGERYVTDVYDLNGVLKNVIHDLKVWYIDDMSEYIMLYDGHCRYLICDLSLKVKYIYDEDLGSYIYSKTLFNDKMIYIQDIDAFRFNLVNICIYNFKTNRIEQENIQDMLISLEEDRYHHNGFVHSKIFYNKIQNELYIYVKLVLYILDADSLNVKRHVFLDYGSIYFYPYSNIYVFDDDTDVYDNINDCYYTCYQIKRLSDNSIISYMSSTLSMDDGYAYCIQENGNLEIYQLTMEAQ